MRYLGADALSSSKLFIARGFLDAALCHEFSAEARRGKTAPATIIGIKGKDLLDERRRRTRRVAVSGAAQHAIQGRFAALLPDLERHFGMRLSGFQDPQFLRYQRGDFFGPHQDSSSHPDHGLEVRTRKVSVILFLNRQTRFSEPEGYCGGELRLFWADGNPDPALHVAGEAGLLVAFPSDLLHEVRPVTHGDRYTVVTWYVGERAVAQ